MRPRFLFRRAAVLILGAQAVATIAAAWIAAVGRPDALIVLMAGGSAFAVSGAALWWMSRGHAGDVAALRAAESRVAATGAGAVSEEERVRAARPRSMELASVATGLNDALDRLYRDIDGLRAQSEQQEAILQSMDGGVIALDLEQRVIRLNRAAERLLGLTGRPVRGRLIQEAVRQPDLNRFISFAMADPSIQDDEFALVGRQPITVRAACGPLRDADGQRVGLLVVLADVTELRRLETVRTDFAANVSHELRTPITNIKGYLETLLETGMDDQEQALRFLKTIHRNAERLGAIVEDMLTLTRLERPEAGEALVVSSTPVTEIVESVMAQAMPEALAKQITLDSDVPEPLRAMVNSQLVEQAVSNLVSNAIKYSPEGSRVMVRARRVDAPDEQPMTEIAVEDEGPGVAAEHLPRIFERFYRVDKARSREQGGTGLGLAIVKHIAMVHGGRAEVESEPGRGSVFKIVLPTA